MEQMICINPWRQARTGDATVTPKEVAWACLVSFDQPQDDWLEVQTNDGRIISTELRKNQANIDDIVDELRMAGVSVQPMIIFKKQNASIIRGGT